MNNLLIQLPVNEKERFVVYLSLLNNFIYSIKEETPKIEPLTPRELEVLSLLCYYNKLYMSLPEPQRESYLHSNDIRRNIKDELEIDTNNYNNILGRLSKKIIIFNKMVLYNQGKINPLLAIDITTYEGVEFKFKPKITNEV